MPEPTKTNRGVNEIKEDIKKLTIAQISELAKGLKEDLNIQEEVMVPQATATPSEKSEEKKETGNASVKLVEMKEGLNKIEIYRVIMEAVNEELKSKGEPGISIVQAKKLTERENKIILENVSREKADSLKKQLEEKGKDKIKVEIK